MNGDFSKIAVRVKKLFDIENSHRGKVLNPNAFVSSELKKYVKKLLYIDAFALKCSLVDRSLCYYELFEVARVSQGSEKKAVLTKKEEFSKKTEHLAFAIVNSDDDAIIFDKARDEAYETSDIIQLLLETECLRHEKIENLAQSTGEYKKKIKRKLAALEEFYKLEKISDSKAESEIINSLELFFDEQIEGITKINGLLAIEMENGKCTVVSPFQAIFSPKVTIKVNQVLH